jgi:hypothetical protein
MTKYNKAVPAAPPPPCLPPPEAAAIAVTGLPATGTETALDRKQAVLRDYLGAVVDGGLLGAYYFGRPATGKSRLVRDELERREVRYVYTAGHITAKGLFQLLRRYPDSLHVLDDCESTFRYVQSVEILRAALASQDLIVHGKDYRFVRWASWNRSAPEEFPFTGKIIGLGNLPFPDGPTQDALRSRVVYANFVVSDEEIIEMMPKLAGQGHKSVAGFIEPEECREVAEYVIGQFVVRSKPVDLRAYLKALEIYLPWSLKRTHSDWHDQVQTMLWEYLAGTGEVASREALDASRQEEDALLREVLALDCRVEEQFEIWRTRTKGPKSRATFFRRKQIIEAGGVL